MIKSDVTIIASADAMQACCHGLVRRMAKPLIAMSSAAPAATCAITSMPPRVTIQLHQKLPINQSSSGALCSHPRPISLPAAAPSVPLLLDLARNRGPPGFATFSASDRHRGDKRPAVFGQQFRIAHLQIEIVRELFGYRCRPDASFPGRGAYLMQAL